MGLFLSASGVVGADHHLVSRGIDSFTAGRGGTFEIADGALEDRHIGVMSTEEGRCTIIYPQDFIGWDELSQHLSLELQKPVFSFHIHDGDLWMFQLYNNGELVTRYNPIPDYWGDVDEVERSLWAGDADAIHDCIPSIPAESIQEYFVPWSEADLGGGEKAYSDDEFARGVDWQLTDFMRRIGLSYPVQDDGTLKGKTFHLRIRRQRV